MRKVSQNYERPEKQIFNVVRDLVIRLKLDIVSSDKVAGVLQGKTETKYIFFGGIIYSFIIREIDTNKTQVAISTQGDISQNAFDSFTVKFFKLMDKAFPTVVN